MVEFEKPYNVGKGKPPRHSQWRPGHSGNPSGRPKGARSLTTILREKLEEVVILDGKSATHSEHMANRLLNDFIFGDDKAIALAAIKECFRQGAQPAKSFRDLDDDALIELACAIGAELDVRQILPQETEERSGEGDDEEFDDLDEEAVPGAGPRPQPGPKRQAGPPGPKRQAGPPGPKRQAPGSRPQAGPPEPKPKAQWVAPGSKRPGQLRPAAVEDLLELISGQ
jgi:hypothetical protein